MKLFSKTKKIELFAPVDGECIPLEQINDKVFSSKLMGDGVAFKFNGNTVYSPVEGIITMVFPTKHAYGIRTKNGAEILIHIGMDTANLNGLGFTSLVKEGDKVRVHDPLTQLDRSIFEKNNLSLINPLVITNSQEISYEFLEVGNNVDAGKTVIGYIGK